MGKKLFLFAAAAVALASCTETDLSGDTSFAKESTSDAIQFSAKAGNSGVTRTVTTQDYVKGTIGNADNTNMGITKLASAGFGVFAYYTGAVDYDTDPVTSQAPDFMYNQKLEWSETNPTEMWIYSPVKYWPNGIDADNVNDPSHTALQKNEGKLSFFAFAPYTGTTGAYDTDDTAYPSTIQTADLNKTGKTSGVSAITNNAWKGNVWVKYLMPNASQAEAVDLLWGLAGKATYDEADGKDPGLKVGEDYNINLTKQTVKETASERVSFLFKHALAKVGGATTDETESTEGDPKQCGFKVVADVDANDGDKQNNYFPSSFKPEETLITIKEVKIQDGKSATDDSSVPVTGVESDFNTFGWFNIETGQWSNKENTYGYNSAGATYSITANNDATLDNDDAFRLNEKILEIGAGKHDATEAVKKLKDANGKEWSTGNPSGVTTTPQPLFAKENVPGLLVIPGGNGNNLYITIDYYVRTADPNLNKGYTEVEQIITNKVSLGSLDPNKYYTIIMHLGLTSVKFEAKVVDWTAKAGEAWNPDGTDASTGEDNESKVWLPSNVVSANQWAITPSASATPIAAKGADDITLTVQMNTNNLTYNASGDAGQYSLSVDAGSSWLTESGGTLTATPNNASTADRTAIVYVSTKVNGNTITTPITLTQKGYALKLTAGTNSVTVKDGDDQLVNLTSGYEITVTGGDANKPNPTGNNDGTISLSGGTTDQAYKVTVTHTASGATASTDVTITAP